MDIWNEYLIFKYQSIWCTIEKIKFLNMIDGFSLRKYLHGTKSKNIYNLDSLYISQYNFKENYLIELCKSDIFKQIKNELTEILGNINNNLDMEKYIVYDFRFCPECLKNGYHSIFHQLNLFDKCIFHNIPLESKCPKCNEVHSYYLKYDGGYGFYCNCGYNYLEKEDFLAQLNIWKNQNSNSEFNIDKKIYNFGDNNIYFFTSLEFYINKYINKYTNYYLEDNTFIYTSLNKKIEDVCSYRFTTISSGINIPKFMCKDIYDTIDYIFMDQYIIILKYISKHLRKKIKKKNYKFYISNFLFFNFESCRSHKLLQFDEVKYKGIDDYLYAYIVWIFSVEGINDYTKINLNNASNQKVRKDSIKNSIFYTYINHELRTYIWNVKCKNNYNGFDDINILFSGLERILGDILINYFYDCLDFIKEKKN